VEESNLHRQILYTTKDLGKNKLESAKEKLISLNPNIKIDLYNKKLNSNNALDIITNYDLVIDGSDNFPTRYLVNDACVLSNKPNIYGSIFRFEGQCSVFNYRNGPCYRCLFPHPPPNTVKNCTEAGVLGVLPGIIGTLQATEAIKIILGKGEVLSGRFLVYDALNAKFDELKLNKNKSCVVCGEKPSITELIDYEQFCNDPETNNEITPNQLKSMMDKKEDLILVDTREKVEWDICKINGAKLISFNKIMQGNLDDFENFDKGKNIILYCHTGSRSAYTLDLLKKKGFKNLKNLVGGIDAWAKEIDLTLPIY